MLRPGLLAVLVLVAGLSTALAADMRIPGMRTNDVFFTEDGLQEKLVNREVMFQDGSSLRFLRNGTAEYRSEEGARPMTGRYAFKRYGMVCIRFDNGASRCDTFVRSVRDTVVLTGGGRRLMVDGIVSF